MKFENIDWIDSDLEYINIEYNQAILKIWNDSMRKFLQIKCTGLVGVTNLCIWDDTIITEIHVRPVSDRDSKFVHCVFEKYDKDYDYGGRVLSAGLIELKIHLASGIPFEIICQSIDVMDCDS